MDTTDIQAECYFAHLNKIAKLFSDFFEKKQNMNPAAMDEFCVRFYAYKKGARDISIAELYVSNTSSWVVRSQDGQSSVKFLLNIHQG